jgi:hypothetical protein
MSKRLGEEFYTVEDKGVITHAVTQYSLSTCAKPVDKTQDAISAL